VVIGTYLLLFGPILFGFILNSLGYYGIGGNISVIIGLILLHFYFPLGKVIKECFHSVFLLLWMFIILVFFYIYGPQTSYAFSLLISFLKFYLLCFFGFYYCLRINFDWRLLGLMGIFTGIIYLSWAGNLNSSILPKSILDIGALRTSHVDISLDFYVHLAAFLPTLGFMFIYGSNADKSLSRSEIFLLACTLLVTLVMVSWSGARQGIFYLGLGSVSIFICKLHTKFRRYVIFSLIILFLISIVFSYGMFKGFTTYEILTDSSSNIYERLNRERVFSSAIQLIKEKPFLGHGLGGYNIPDYNLSSNRMYAHNFLLDMLSQMGVIGTLLFFSPLFLARVIRSRIQMSRYLFNGNVILPILSVYFLHSLISGAFVSIAQSIALISVAPKYKITKK
jgi:O-antigen ligase